VLKICDLGTAIDRSDAATASTEITPYLVSRFYRAPEIILGAPYDCAVDMWSIGCTLYELYTGKILFTGDSNNQMLKNIMEIRGKLSAKVYRRGQLAGLHFDDAGNFQSVERDRVLGKVSFETQNNPHFQPNHMSGVWPAAVSINTEPPAPFFFWAEQASAMPSLSASGAAAFPTTAWSEQPLFPPTLVMVGVPHECVHP